MDIDSLGVGKALELFPEQIKKTWKQAYSSELPKFSPDSVVISGMGGSSNAAKIIQGIYESELKIPIYVFNDYDLPEWIDKNTLVVANSYSGNTEETLSCLEAVKKAGAKLVAVTTGGKLADMIREKKILGAIFDPAETNPTHFPKTGLGASFGALAGTLSKTGVLKISEKEMFKAADELTKLSKEWDTKAVASWLKDSLPVLFGGRPFIGSLNAGRNAMCEISRNFTQFYEFPEVNHVLIEATQKPSSAKNKIKYFLFVSKFNHPRVLLRYKVTARILKEQGLEFSHHALKGSTRLAQSLEIPYFCAWVGYHLSLLQKTDPGPEPWITKLKDSLAQPVH